MFDETEVSPRERTEADLRATVTALERQRLDPFAARYALHIWIPIRMFFTLGHPEVLAAEAGTLIVSLVLTALSGSWIVVVIGVLVLVGLTGYADSQMDGWVADHNARLDHRIQAVHRAAGGDPPH